jgi:hypothetical protein
MSPVFIYPSKKTKVFFIGFSRKYFQDARLFQAIPWFSCLTPLPPLYHWEDMQMVLKDIWIHMETFPESGLTLDQQMILIHVFVSLSLSPLSLSLTYIYTHTHTHTHTNIHYTHIHTLWKSDWNMLPFLHRCKHNFVVSDEFIESQKPIHRMIFWENNSVFPPNSRI